MRNYSMFVSQRMRSSELTTEALVLCAGTCPHVQSWMKIVRRVGFGMLEKREDDCCTEFE